MQQRCPHCGKELGDTARIGVHLSVLKAKIYDLVKRAGREGIDRDLLFDLVMRIRGVKRNTLKTHISQINDLLAGTDYQIRCGKGNLNYRLMKDSNAS
jgi:hypothetical protein